MIKAPLIAIEEKLLNTIEVKKQISDLLYKWEFCELSEDDVIENIIRIFQ